MVRVLPLWVDRERVGAIVLCRDVSDVRSKERLLVTKDATIREIHHRVKNNLQTVAALLRMQARRISSPEARVALNDAMSRVSSIAIVHETLAQAFDEIVEFDRVADGLLRMVGEVAASWGGVSAVRKGSFGLLSADVATSLAMIITELCQNAVEHGLADHSGEVRVVPTAADGRLRVEISDDGRGLPEGFDWRHVAQPRAVDRDHAGGGDGGLVHPRPPARRARDAGRGRNPDLEDGRLGARSDDPAKILDRPNAPGFPVAELFTSTQRSRGMFVRRTVHGLAGRRTGRCRRHRPAGHGSAGAGPSDSRCRPQPRLRRREVGPAAARALAARHSLRAPVTDENFYFVMADRFENGDTANDTGGIAG